MLWSTEKSLGRNQTYGLASCLQAEDHNAGPVDHSKKVAPTAKRRLEPPIFWKGFPDSRDEFGGRGFGWDIRPGLGEPGTGWSDLL